jgi:serine/threonine-protein kinase
MSAVYKATDPNLKRVVAIKLIHSHLSSDTQFIQRFEEEAAAVASLRHPNIVHVYEYNSDQGVHYMVLEFVPGETLQSRLQRLNAQQRKLPVDEAIKYTLNICDALNYAHQRGIIHRDIKPANIMLDVNGQAILMDFGIVKIIGNTSHTATGAVLGTASYISPELIRSEQADPRSDIYSLGITLYEMLSGQPPFKADSAMTLMMMHLNDPVPDPRTLRTDLPSSLVNILLKTLEKNRANRYQNVSELAADLKKALNELQGGQVFSTQFNQPAATIITPAASVAAREVTPPPIRPNQPTIVEQQPQNYTPPPVSRTSGVSQQYTPPPASRSASAPPKKNSALFWVFGLGGGLLFFVVLLAVAGLLIMARRLANNAQTPTETVNTPAQVVVETPLPVAPPTSIPVTNTPDYTPTPDYVAPTVEPTATYPTYYVRINTITLSGNQYVVQYETFGYTEKLPWMHVHFFFNTVPPEQAGMPGSGPWILYGGPRPFKGYTVGQRPEGATQMCALVAHANHTVIQGSGNCVDLP